MTLTEQIKEKAVELGFDCIGIAPARRAPHEEAFYKWLRAGHQGAMQWMAKNPERRADPAQVVPGARSVVSVGISYYTDTPPDALWNDPSRGRIARYAWGPDYHAEIEPLLKALIDFVRAQTGGAAGGRYYIDTGPVLEREAAWQASLGFIGKNTLLIRPDRGSYVFLGELILDVELDYDAPAQDRGAALSQGSREGTCGSCRRCLDQCPTRAFPAAYTLNATRCLSYLTIELKDAIPVDLRPLMKNWIFGCDECQEVCPWVRRYATPGRTRFLSADPNRIAPPLLELMGMDEAAFRRRYKGTPLQRVKRRGLLRNVAVAIGNWGSREALPVLEQALRDEEPLVREHAEWALQRIG